MFFMKKQVKVRSDYATAYSTFTKFLYRCGDGLGEAQKVIKEYSGVFRRIRGSELGKLRAARNFERDYLADVEGDLESNLRTAA